MPTLTVNGVPCAYDQAGEGSVVLLIHAGIADRRMWDGIWPALTARHRVVRADLRGYGDTPLPDGPFVHAADLAALLEALGIERADVVGVSMGGGVAMDLALAHPDLVDHLVLVAPGIGGWAWGPTMDEFDEAETAALERGDLNEASWLNVRHWVDGIGRSPTEVDPELRRRVFEMQRRAFELDNAAAEGRWLVADRQNKLDRIAAPTLVVVGELDQPDFAAIGRLLTDGMPDARLELMPGVAHLPPMEAPEAFSRLVQDFLGG